MGEQNWALLERAEVILKSDDYQLSDLGDGVLCFEIHSKNQTLTTGVSKGLSAAVEFLERRQYCGMVLVSPPGKNFCVGANLLKVAEDYRSRTMRKTVDDIILSQNAYMAMKYASKPCVTAPAKRALGGGAEMCLHGAQVAAASNLMLGLVEANIGLIPSAGGCKEMLLRCYELEGHDADRAAKRAFEIITGCAVSANAGNARELGYLRAHDMVDGDPEKRVEEGKAAVLRLTEDGYHAPERMTVHLASGKTYAALMEAVLERRAEGKLGEHDVIVFDQIARVITNADGEEITVDEGEILFRERNTFYDLAMHEKTQARIAHMLQTGKKLEN